MKAIRIKKKKHLFFFQFLNFIFIRDISTFALRVSTETVTFGPCSCYVQWNFSFKCENMTSTTLATVSFHFCNRNLKTELFIFSTPLVALILFSALTPLPTQLSIACGGHVAEEWNTSCYTN